MRLVSAAPLAVALMAGAAGAQRPQVDVLLPPTPVRAAQGPVVRAAQLLADSRVADLLSHGFPARVHYTLERWSVERWFDNLRESYEWSMIVRSDPLGGGFHVLQVHGNQVRTIGDYATLTAADSAVGAPRRIPITPPAAGQRSYYVLRVEVNMVSVTDLHELERWLRGELRPAVRGRRSAGTALERGAGTLLVKLLGGEQRRYAARTERFVP